jgi:hypothetical protein
VSIIRRAFLLVLYFGVSSGQKYQAYKSHNQDVKEKEKVGCVWGGGGREAAIKLGLYDLSFILVTSVILIIQKAA